MNAAQKTSAAKFDDVEDKQSRKNLSPGNREVSDCQGAKSGVAFSDTLR